MERGEGLHRVLSPGAAAVYAQWVVAGAARDSARHAGPSERRRGRDPVCAAAVQYREPGAQPATAAVDAGCGVILDAEDAEDSWVVFRSWIQL